MIEDLTIVAGVALSAWGAWQMDLPERAAFVGVYLVIGAVTYAIRAEMKPPDEGSTG